MATERSFIRADIDEPLSMKAVGSLMNPDVNQSFTIMGLVVIFVLGFCIIIQNLILLVSIHGCISIPSSTRRLVIYHSIILILQAITLLKGSLIIVFPSITSDCFALKVIKDLVESLAQWDVVLMGILALGLCDVNGSLHKISVQSLWCYQIVFIASTWVMSLSEAGLIAVLTNRYTTEGCSHFNRWALLITAVCRSTAFVGLAVIVVLYVRMARRRTSTTIPSGSPRRITSRIKRKCTHLSEKRRTARSLVIQCATTLVLTSPCLCIYFVEIAIDDELHWIYFLCCVLAYLSYLTLMVIFFIRHAEVRDCFKKVVCHKCLINSDETFHHSVNDRYNRVQCSRDFLKDPEVAARFLADDKKKKSVANMPALQQIILKAHSEDNAVDAACRPVASVSRSLASVSRISLKSDAL